MSLRPPVKSAGGSEEAYRMVQIHPLVRIMVTLNRLILALCAYGRTGGTGKTGSQLVPSSTESIAEKGRYSHISVVICARLRARQFGFRRARLTGWQL
jgi:hypothetical protein